MKRQDAKVAKNLGLIEPRAELDDLAHRGIGAAIEVHRLLGPGFLESVYEEALFSTYDHELTSIWRRLDGSRVPLLDRG